MMSMMQQGAPNGEVASTVEEEFAIKWGLNAESVDKLYALSEEVRVSVMAEFAPAEGVQNIDGLFGSFARSRAKKLESGDVALPPVDSLTEEQLMEFAKTWNLSEESTAFLQGIPPVLATEVVANFLPREEVSNVDKLFHKFTLSRVPKIIPYFLRENSLESKVEAILKEMSTLKQLEVMMEFKPGADVTNPTGKFVSFAKSRRDTSRRPPPVISQARGAKRSREDSGLETAPQQKRHQVKGGTPHDVTSFIQHWNLGADMQVMMQIVPPEVQQRIVSSFDPRGNVRNIDGLVASFAKSVMRSHALEFATQYGLSEEVLQEMLNVPIEVLSEIVMSFEPRGEVRNIDNLMQSFIKSRMAKHGGSVQGTTSVRSSRPSTGRLGRSARALIDRFQLDDEVQALLGSVTMEDHDAIASEFEPRPGVKNVNNLFKSFFKSRYGAGQAAPAPPGLRRSSGPFANPRGTSPSAFVRQWNLDSRSAQILQNLAPQVQEDIMASFQPHAGVHDINGMFQKFAQSRAFGPTPKTEKPARKSSSGGNGGGTNGHASMDVESFRTLWGLGEEAIQALLELPAGAQKEVMGAFAPRETPRDPDRMFLSFLKGAARRRS